VSIYDEGAYTGEVSAFQLKKLNIDYAIVGHSERRIHFNETDSHINVKIHKLLDNDIIPILCFGESLEDRSQGSYLDYIKNQVNEGLKGIRKDKVSKLVLAYEPIWSIGTGEVASIEDIVEVLDCVKNLLLEKQYYSEEDIKFIYGGSVSSDNSTDILNTKIIDGALVGGASLDADKFVDIIKSVSL
jgi:triosephosphate isomerase